MPQNELLAVLPHFLYFLAPYKYLLIFCGALFEGPVVMVVSGFLVRMETFPFWPAYLVLIAGDLVADIGWYGLGRLARERVVDGVIKFFGATHESFEKLERVFNKHDLKILFISKITTGFGFAILTLLAAGAARVPFRRYLMMNFLGEFIWAGMLMGVGYLFGHAYTHVSDIASKIELIVGMIALAFAGAWLFSKLAKKFFADRLVR
jgi:membrane protein DedA with SNARE-associated domain